MSLDDRSVPLWSAVLDDLRRRLDAGEFTDRFPGDRDLVDHYGVSRHTVREAVRHLQDEGRLTRYRGRGSFVTSPPLEQSLGTLYSLFQSVETQGMRQDSIVCCLDERDDDDARSMLSLGSGEQVVYLERVRLVDGEPIAWDRSWLPSLLASRLLAVDFRHTALYKQLHDMCGLRPMRGWERIQPVLPDPHRRELLGLGERDPAFAVERMTYADDRPLEWRQTVIRGDRFSFVARWSGTDARTAFEGR